MDKVENLHGMGRKKNQSQRISSQIIKSMHPNILGRSTRLKCLFLKSLGKMRKRQKFLDSV